jgi:manganese/iron transport system permease protein
MHNILFGNISLLPRQEVVMAWALAGLVLLCVLLLFKELVFFCFDEETATVFGVNTSLVYFGLLVLVGLAIVAAMRSLGVILASALLVLPGAAARPLSNRIGWVSLFSAVISVAGTVAGVWLSILIEGLSPAALIVLVLCLILVATHLYGALRNRRNRRSFQDSTQTSA